MKVYEKIKALLLAKGISYIEEEHHQEGYGTHIAKIHGVDEHFGAKALVLSLQYADKRNGKPTYCLAIIPFTSKLDTQPIKAYFGAKKVSFAPPDVSQKLTECEPGAIPPFSFNQDLPVLIDTQIKSLIKIFFNAGRLDRSICLKVSDYLRAIENNNYFYDFITITKTQ